MTPFLLAALVVVAALLAAACTTSEPAASPTTPPAIATPTEAPQPTAAAPTPTVAPVVQPTPAETPPGEAAAGPGEVSVTVGPGSEARYLVNEQLARLNSPIDAIGTTEQVEGAIVFDAEGAVDSARSKITVDMASLRTDSDRRDGYVRNNTLETSKFPTAELVVKSVPGLPWPLPSSGEVDFEIVGDMTIHGVTTELTWQATAQFREGGVTGQAKTNFTFDTFDMDIPRVFVVVSVEDNIRLEIDFEATITSG